MTRRTVLLLAALLLSAGLAASDRAFAGTPEQSAALARCVDDSAIAVVRLDLEQINTAAATKNLAEFAGTGLIGSDVSSLNSLATSMQALRAAGAQSVCAVFMPAPLSDRNPYYVALVEQGSDVSALVQQIKKTPNPSCVFVVSANATSFAAVAAVGDAVVAGDGEVVARLKNGPPSHRPELEAAWATAGSAPIALFLVPSADQRKAFEETLPELPHMIGGGSTVILTQGLIWATASYTPDSQTLDLVIQSQNPAAAAAFAHYLRDLPGKVPDLSWMKSVFPQGHLPDSLMPTVQNNRLMLSVKRSNPGAAILEQAVAEAGKALRTSLWQTARRDNLKTMALAMHNFHDVHHRFPAQAIYDKKNGRPLLSWRVQLLPFLEENKLYNDFHLDEPWDSEHNRKLIERIPSIFRSPELSSQDFGKTPFQGGAGKHAFFQGTEGVEIRQITDGTVNTIMVLEAAANEAVAWTKPEDIDVDADRLHERLFNGRDSFGAAMCDGSAHVLKKSITEKTLRALFTINGGEIIPEGF